jgi:hypothetical protein
MRANAAPDSAGTSEARMSSAVGPVYWPIPTTVIRNRLPSLTVSLRRGAAMRNPAAMSHNMVYGGDARRSGGISQRRAGFSGCAVLVSVCLRAASRDDYLLGSDGPTVIRSFKRLNSQRDGTASQRAFRGVGAWHVRRPAHQAERRLNPSSHPILVANPCFTELLPQLPFLSPDEKIDQRNVDGGDDECGR